MFQCQVLFDFPPAAPYIVLMFAFLVVMFLLGGARQVTEPGGVVVYGMDGQIAREWRVSREAPGWLRVSARRAAMAWAASDAGFDIRLRFVSPGEENIFIGETMPQYEAVTIMGHHHPIIIVDPTTVDWYGQAQLDAIIAHEMGHALCGCALHHTRSFVGIMGSTIGTNTTYITIRDRELLWKGRGN